MQSRVNGLEGSGRTGGGDSPQGLRPHRRKRRPGRANGPRQPRHRLSRRLLATLAVVLCVLGSVVAFAVADGGVGAASESASPAAPTTSKTLTPNGDGTYTLSLSVTGQASSSSSATKANVVVVMDRSNSMDESSGSWNPDSWSYYTKLDVEKQAALILSDTLSKYNTDENPDTVEFALIDFGGEANLAQSPTSDVSAYESAVNGVSSISSPAYQGATNWEAALQLAKETADSMQSGDRADVPTFIIFVSDGVPTLRETAHYTEAQLHGNAWSRDSMRNYRNAGSDLAWWNYTYDSTARYRYVTAAPYGAGDDDPNGYGYSYALDDAQSIVDSGYGLFAIGAYSGTSGLGEMRNLAEESGAGVGNYYNATDSASLSKAFSDITSTIVNSFGYSDVKMTDVLTGMTSADILGGTVDSSAVSYTKTDSSGTSSWEGAPAISVSGSTVSWDLSSLGRLENGVAYTASFRVWPSQEAYDLVAQLENADDPSAAYDALADAQKAQIAKIANADGTTGFGLKTNTDDTSVSYTQTFTETSGTLPEGRELGVTYTTVVDGVTYDVVYAQNADGSYTMTRSAAGTASIDNPDPMPLESSVMTVAKAWDDGESANRPGSATLSVLQDGTKVADVTLSADNNWSAQVHIAPGLIANGETLEAGHEYTVAEGSIPEGYELSQSPTHPMIVEGVLQASSTDAAAPVLTATNSLEGTILIGKSVTHADGLEPDTENTTFTYTVSMKDASGNPVEGVKYVYAAEGSTASIAEGTISDGDTFTLHANEHYLLEDVPIGTTYTVTESEPSGAYTLAAIDVSGGATSSVDDGQASGTIAAASVHEILFQNEYHVTATTADISVSKRLGYTSSATDVPDISGKYTFTLAAGVNDAGVDTPMPATTVVTNPGTGNGTGGYDAHDGGTASFGAIEFTRPGNYAYTVTESGSVAGVANDVTSVKNIGVVVTDNGDGTLTATVYGADGGDSSATTFSNDYQMPAEATLEVSKALLSDPAGLSAPDVTGKFTFTLQPDSEHHADQTAVPMPDGSTTSDGNVTYQVTNPVATGGTVSFPSISYDSAGTYYYIVTESGSVDGVTNDVSYDSATGTYSARGGVRYVTVTVTEETDDATGLSDLAASISVYDSRETQESGAGATSAAGFINLYQASPVTVSIPVNKDLEADGALNPPDITGLVTFTLKRLEASNPMPGGVDADTATTTNGTVVDSDTTQGLFEDITFTVPGTYDYVLSESATIGGVSVETVERPVSVTVTDDGTGALKATLSSPATDPVTFTNTYTVQPASETLKASKTLSYADGLSPASIAGKFSYTITAGTNDAGVDTPMPATTVVTNPGTGNGTGGYDAHDGGTASFGSIEFTTPGTYHYTIAESGSADGVTNDADTTRDVTITVTDNRDGTLSATVSGDATADGTVSFTNSYSVASTTSTIPVAKAMQTANGLMAPDITDAYSYSLEAAAGTPMPEGATTANGTASVTVTGPSDASTTDPTGGLAYAGGSYTAPGTYSVDSFGTISYDAPGTYTYVVKESGSVAGITNDAEATSGKTVVATVSDDGAGGLEVSYSYGTTTLSSTDPLVFTNTYAAPASVTATIPVTKQISGDFGGDASRWFAFTLTSVAGTPMPDDGTTTISNPDATGGTASFGQITFTRPGIYQYEIRETSAAHNGFTNDADNPKAVAILVADPQDGTGLTVQVLGADSEVTKTDPQDPSTWTIEALSGSTTFTNTYKADSVTADIPVSKTVEVTQEGISAPDISGKFTFTLTAGTNDAGVDTPMPDGSTTTDGVTSATVTNPDADGGVASFGDIEFTKAGTYHYTVAESGTVAGFTNDANATREVVATVTDDGTGALAVSITCDDATVTDDAPIAFTNTFTPATASIGGTKTVSGRTMLPGESFEFQLSAGDDATSAAIESGTVVLGSSESSTAATTLTTEVENITDGETESIDDFAPITFKEPGTYTFTVSEVAGSASGMSYDTATHDVTVTVVEDATTHALSATVDADEQAAVAFTNTYSATGSVTPEGTKTLYGDDATTSEAVDAGAFTFKVEYVNGTLTGDDLVAATGTNEAASAGSSAKIDFTQLSYSTTGADSLQHLVDVGAATLDVAQDGTATYTIDYRVVEDTVSSSYQPNYQEFGFTVTVVDKGEGSLDVLISYEDGGIAFTNRTAGQTATVAIDGTKALTGRTLKAGEFSFSISSADASAPLPATTTVTNDASGAVDFGDITFDSDDLGAETSKEYSYTIAETVPQGATDNGDGTYAYRGVTYANVSQDVTITLSRDASNNLVATVSAGTLPFSFTNSYEAADVSVQIPVAKSLVAGSGATNLPDITGAYTFTLASDTAAEPMPEGTGNVVTNPDATGGTAYFGSIAYATTGIYNYTITESGTVAGVTNDAAAASGKHVTVIVSDDGLGSLVATVVGADTVQGSGQAVATTTFANTYEVTPATVRIPVSKALASGDAATDLPNITNAFTFTLSAADGTPMPAGSGNVVTNPAEDGGTEEFGAITYQAPGTYTYTITETGAVAGVTNDEAAASGKTVEVTVADDGQGHLVATVAGADGTGEVTTFTNTYQPGSATAEVFAAKQLVTEQGVTAPDVAGKFTITLTAGTNDAGVDTPMPEGSATADGTVTKSVTNPDGSGGSVSFGGIEFTRPGTYRYTVSETGYVTGVLNDASSAREVVVSVTDDASGTLKATVTSDNAVVSSDSPVTFTNAYYTPAELEGSTAIAGTKTIEGRDMLAGEEFTFTLSAADSATSEALANDVVVLGGSADATTLSASVTNAKAGSAASFVFDRITFMEPGDYSFAVTEADGGTTSAGLAYDGSTHVVRVHVERSATSNVLVATPNADDIAALAFTNTYEASTSIDPPGTKTLLGTDGSKQAMEAGAFTFETRYAEGARKGQVVSTGTNAACAAGASASIEFGSISYDMATLNALAADGTATKGADESGNATYTISYDVVETAGNVSGLLKNTQVEGFTVTITDDGAGNLGASVAFDNGTDGVQFTNYPSSVTAMIDVSGTKAILGDRPLATGEFSFTISGVDEDGATDVPLPSVTTVTNGEAGTVDFGTITFEYQDSDDGTSELPVGSSKTYTYTITESGSQPGVTNDAAQTFSVTVTRGEDGFLTVSTSPASAPLFSFNNSYEPEPGESSVTDQVSVSKLLAGRDLADGEFGFALKATSAPDGATMPETVNATNAADGTVTFPSVTFDRPGAYTFELSEDAGSEEGVTYDQTTYNVTAVVTDSYDGSPMRVHWVYGGGDGITFENVYEPVVGSLTVSKTVKGEGGSRSEFGFTITLSDATVNGTYGDVTFKDGVGRVTLRDGETAVIPGLDAGMGYTVAEDDYSGSYTTESTGATGTIVAGQSSAASFVNTVVEKPVPTTPDETTPTAKPKAIPKTGDASPDMPAVLAVAALGAGLLALRRRIGQR